jgi:hypothetical protein
MVVLILYLNIAAGATAAAIYGIWSLKWLQRKVWTLGVLNLLAATACFGFAVGYAFVMLNAEMHGEVVRLGFRHLGPFVLLAPALARFVELRREERREAFAIEYERELRG